MIPLNSRQALPSKAFGYLALRSMLAAVMLVLIGGLVQLLSALPSTCHGALCGVCLSGRQFAGILYLLGALILVGAVLNYKWFSFLLTDKTIRIDSGVMFRRSCTIRFDRIQDVDILRNPMHLLLGLKSVAIWTASFDQSHSRPHHLRSQQLVSTPPGREATDFTIACTLQEQARVDDVLPCSRLSEGRRCEHEEDFPSQPTVQAEQLSVVNHSDQTLKFYWLDRSGARSLYGVMSPGSQVSQPSHQGAHWLILTEDGRCVGIFNALTIRVAIF